jgi:hypothetical protein
MKMKNLAPIIIVTLVVLVLNSSGSYAEIPVCTKPDLSCSNDIDCCPVYFTEYGVFYGKCISGKCKAVDGSSSSMTKLDLCKEIYNADGTVRNQDLLDYYTLSYSDFLGWDSGIPLAQQYYSQGLTSHVCDLIFPEYLPESSPDQFNYKYDIYNNLVSITTPNGEQERNYYDFLHPNRPYATESMEKGLTKVYYDGAGNVIKAVDSKRTRVFTEYDEYYRVKRVYSPTDPTINVKYYYGDDPFCPSSQPENKLCGVEDYSGTTYYDYDDRGRIEHKTKNIKDTTGGFKTYTIEYGYDSADNLYYIKHVEGTTEVKYYHNILNQIDYISFKKGTEQKIVDYTYNPTGTINSKTTGLHSTSPGTLLYTDYSYNPRDRMTSIYVSKGSHYNPSYEMFKRTQGYDPAGNVINISNYINFGSPGSTPANPGSVLTYDPINRLESEDHDSSIINPPITINYLYDMVGNREWLDKSTGGYQDYIYYDNRLVKIAE